MATDSSAALLRTLVREALDLDAQLSGVRAFAKLGEASEGTCDADVVMRMTQTARAMLGEITAGLERLEAQHG